MLILCLHRATGPGLHTSRSLPVRLKDLLPSDGRTTSPHCCVVYMQHTYIFIPFLLAIYVVSS